MFLLFRRESDFNQIILVDISIVFLLFSKNKPIFNFC